MRKKPFSGYDNLNNIKTCQEHELYPLNEYRQIQGFSSYYINNKGIVYNKRSNKILNPPHLRKKCFTVKLYKNGVSKRYNIHELVYTHFT